MINTISNFSRKTNKYGDLHFVSFLSAILSRLAYLNDNNFLNKYNAIMGPVIQPQLLNAINNVNQSNLSVLLDDQTLFGLNKTTTDMFANYEYQYNGKNYLDFIALNMPQNVNIINGDIAGTPTFPVPGQPTDPSQVKYISIGWSNYGEIYVVADKRMPNTLFLLFRGTYSAKTAALYSKPSSAIPLTVCKDTTGNPEQFLYGIFKATSEMIHTVVETMRYLATDFLGATQPNSVKIFTTGHSLGGAMCTDFSYLWMGIKKTAPYNAAPYNVLSDNIICISLGAPRCMSASVANKFCNFVSNKQILYLRITTNGDPVPALPPKNPLYPKSGFEHPCSANSTMRAEVSEACAPELTLRPKPNIDYTGNIDCLNYKGRIYAVNPLSHTVYLDILYTNAVDIVNFFKGIGISKEVLRTANGSTVCRLVMGSNNIYSEIFFDVNNSRETPTSNDATVQDSTLTTGGAWFSSKATPTAGIVSSTAPKSSIISSVSTPSLKLGGPVAEDKRMSMQAFNSLIQQMVPLSGNLCPQNGKMTNPFNNQIMPDLSCPGSKFGGKRKTKKSKKSKKSKKTKKSKKGNTRKH
jgi:hypothetical protein